MGNGLFCSQIDVAKKVGAKNPRGFWKAVDSPGWLA
jgi:hypothetical protein